MQITAPRYPLLALAAVAVAVALCTIRVAADEAHERTPQIVFGELRVNQVKQPLRLPKRDRESVLITGIPSIVDRSPGVAQAIKTGPADYHLWFQEWSYLDADHTWESVPYLWLETGHWTLSDGAVWEAGSFELAGNRSWESIAFHTPFPATPQLFLSAQSFANGRPFLPRANNLTSHGFAAALFPEEADQRAFGGETIGYLAVYHPSGKGKLRTRDGEYSYLVKDALVGSEWKLIDGRMLALREEASADYELRHGREQISLLLLDRHLFGQDVSSSDPDTATLRRFSGNIEQWNQARLLQAIRQGKPQRAQALLQSGIDPCGKNAGGESALSVALQRQHYAMLDLLIEAGADPDCAIFDQATPLGYAVRTGNLVLVQRLLKAGADVNAPDQGATPLVHAARLPNPRFVRELIAAGANVDQLTRQGSALSAAVNAGNKEVIELLLQAQASPYLEDRKGYSALRLALEHEDRRDIAQLLLSSTTRPQPSANGDWAPLQSALEQGADGLAAQLIESGADVNAGNEKGRTPLMTAAAAGRLGWVEKLLQKGADVRASDLHGESALTLAVGARHLAITEILLQAGAPVNPLSARGLPPLMHGVRNRDLESIRLLLRHGADPDARFAKSEMTALHYAANNGMTKVVEALIEGGSDVDSQDSAGDTPLITALRIGWNRRGQAAVVRRLLDGGANRAVRNHKGLTAADYARAHRGPDSEEILSLLAE